MQDGGIARGEVGREAGGDASGDAPVGGCERGDGSGEGVGSQGDEEEVPGRGWVEEFLDGELFGLDDPADHFGDEEDVEGGGVEGGDEGGWG